MPTNRTSKHPRRFKHSSYSSKKLLVPTSIRSNRASTSNQNSNQNSNNTVKPYTSSTLQSHLTHDIPRQQPPPQPPLILAPISVPCEILFHILSFCSPGTLLSFALTSREYNILIQPLLLKQAISTPHDEDFGPQYPYLEQRFTRSPLICGLQHGNKRLVDAIIAAKSFPPDGRFCYMGRKMSPIHWAVEESFVMEDIVYLLGQGFDVNTRDNNWHTPFFYTVVNQKLQLRPSWMRKMMEILIDNGANTFICLCATFFDRLSRGPYHDFIRG